MAEINYVKLNFTQLKNKKNYLAVSIQRLLSVFCWSSWFHWTLHRKSRPQLSTWTFKINRIWLEDFVVLWDRNVSQGQEIRWLQLVWTETLDQSEDLTFTRGRRCRGVQVNRAQRLQGNIDVVDVVKDHRLLPEGLVGWGIRLIPPWGLSPHSGGTNQLVVSWWSSMSGNLERETIWNEKPCTMVWTQGFPVVFVHSILSLCEWWSED